MLFEIILFLLLGILVGTCTGLIPGIHINLVGVALISLSSTIFYFINPIYFAVFIASLAITHTFIDFIPSIFLGCPSEGTELSILPGHEMLKKGFGYDAIMKTAYGGLYAIIILFVLTIPLAYFISYVYEIIKETIPFILIGICIMMVFSEKKKMSAILVLILTGILGYIVLNLNLKESLFPLLSGLFGSSMLILSLKEKTKIPQQSKLFEKLNSKKIFKPLLAALIGAPLCGFLPGLGGGQAAVIGNSFFKLDKKNFLILLGAVNILVMGLSFISLYAISKTRTGAAVAIQFLVTKMDFKILILIIFVCLITGIICFFLTKYLSLKFLYLIERINYASLSKGILVFLIFMTLILSGITGFFVFLISTITGIYCISLNVKRTNMMGCLLVPTILLYLI